MTRNVSSCRGFPLRPKLCFDAPPGKRLLVRFLDSGKGVVSTCMRAVNRSTMVSARRACRDGFTKQKTTSQNILSIHQALQAQQLHDRFGHDYQHQKNALDHMQQRRINFNPHKITRQHTEIIHSNCKRLSHRTMNDEQPVGSATNTAHNTSLRKCKRQRNNYSQFDDDNPANRNPNENPTQRN